MFFWPIGVDAEGKARVPWVTAAIALLLLVGQLSLLAEGPDPLENQEVAKKEFFALLDYWQRRPYLSAHPEMVHRFMPPSIPRLIEVSADGAAEPSSADLIAYEQQTLDEMSEAFLTRYSRGTREHLMLVPGRGLLQAGWISHILFHGDWLHLLGNLWLLFLVAPTIERHWGWLWLLAIFITGGVVGGVAQAAADIDSWVPILGSSGAIAACMGAFTIAFATSRVRFFYWFFVAIGTFSIPAGVAGALWITGEAYSFGRHGMDTGVATLCHIGGFGLGALAGWAIHAFRNR